LTHNRSITVLGQLKAPSFILLCSRKFTASRIEEEKSLTAVYLA
jgi:hypothetical protein